MLQTVGCLVLAFGIQNSGLCLSILEFMLFCDDVVDDVVDTELTWSMM